MLHYSIYILGNSVHLVQPLWPRLWPKCLLHCHDHDPGICICHYCFASCGKLSILYFTGSCSGVDCFLFFFFWGGVGGVKSTTFSRNIKLQNVWSSPPPPLPWMENDTSLYVFIPSMQLCSSALYVMMHLLHPVWLMISLNPLTILVHMKEPTLINSLVNHTIVNYLSV